MKHTSKVICVNRMNNYGDTLCEMRVLKEWKEMHPELTMDFASCHYLHWLAAYRTDLFDKVLFVSGDEVNQMYNNAAQLGYDGRYEFLSNWGTACDIGILKMWGVVNFGFTPSTDQPYFLTNDEDKVVAKSQFGMIGSGFRKTALLQFQTPSDPRRSFRQEDFERIIDMFPEDVGLIYPTSIDKAIAPILRPRRNVIMLPGYPMGYTAEMMKLTDFVFAVHGGLVMLAYAVGAKYIAQVMFDEACHPNILTLPKEQGMTIYCKNNAEIKWEEMKNIINQLCA